MRVLLDTNVLITYITNREDPYSKEAALIMEMCAEDNVQGFIAEHAFSSIWYILKKRLGEALTRRWLEEICKVLRVASPSGEQILEAVKNTAFRDFEDCLVDKCAERVGADYIVTANVKDYSESTVKAIPPDALCRLIE